MAEFSMAAAVSPGLDKPRDIETITAEILTLKQTAGESILSIGRCLTEAKAALPHGEWSAWLSERVEFSERTAQNFMRLSREWSNPQALADLGATKALTLLALPADERDQFLAEPHDVGGEVKAVVDMTSRELQEAIKDRDAARREAEEARSAADSAEVAMAEVNREMSLTKQLLDAAKKDTDAAQKAKADADAHVAELEAQLAELRAKPVDVAVATVDREALDKARAEAEAAMKDKLDKAKEAKTKAEERRKAAEEELAALRERLEAAEQSAKLAAMTQDKDMATFEVLFNQSQEIVNKMQGLLIKARGREATDLANTIQAAMTALGDSIKEAAK